MTTLQRDALQCFKNQISTANDTLKQLIQRRAEFEAERKPTQEKIEGYQEAASMERDELLELLVCERRLQTIFSFLHSVSPQIAEKEVWLLDQLRKLATIYSEIKGGLPVLERDMPLWAGNAAPPSELATAAVEEIDRLLETKTP